MTPFPLNRRDFLKTSLAAGAAAAVGSCQSGIPECEDSLALGEREELARVVVIGSGFGGAVAAYRLTEMGIPVTMIEKGRRWDVTGTPDEPFSRSLPPDRRSTWLNSKTQLPLGIDFNVDYYVGVLERQRHEGV